MGFKITGHKGFHITFANGVTVSVQFGGGNYGDNYDRALIGTEQDKRVLESGRAEVAVWKGDGKKTEWITKQWKPGDGHNVLGWQTADDVLRLLNWAAEYGESADA